MNWEIILFGLYSVGLVSLGWYVGRMSKWEEVNQLPPTKISELIPDGKTEPQDGPSARKKVPLTEG